MFKVRRSHNLRTQMSANILKCRVRIPQELRTVGFWFDPQVGQYSFPGLMILIATGVIPLSPLTITLIIVIKESRQWLGKNIARSAGKKNSKRVWVGALAAAI